MFIWILIILFVWVLMPIHSNIEWIKIKKIGKTITKTAAPIGKTITTGVTKTANQVGSSIAKIATASLGPDAQMVLKNMAVIKKSIAAFIKKGDDM